MKQPYTSQGIINDYPVRTKPILVHFLYSSEAYRDYGAWIVGTLLKQEDLSVSSAADFPVLIEISAQANALRIAGSDDEFDISPSHKTGSFRGSEVSLIEAYNRP